MAATAQRVLVLAAVLALVALAAVAVAAAVALARPPRRLGGGRSPWAPLPFPVDAVSLWVDGTDAGWRAAARAAATGTEGVVHSPLREPEPTRAGRADELLYSALSLALHLPWLRTLHVVTARPQVPWWWPASGRLGPLRLQLVHHDQLWAAGPRRTASDLPTFNSNAIQAHVDRVPGLAQHFLLLDDDCFAGRGVPPGWCFTPDGRPVVRTYEMDVSAAPPGAWRSICTTMMAAAAREGCGPAPRWPYHTPCALRADALAAALTGPFAADVARIGSVRGFRDVAPHYVATAWAAARGQVVEAPPELDAAFWAMATVPRPLEARRWPPPHWLCLNDRLWPQDRVYLAATLLARGADALAAVLPPGVQASTLTATT